MFSLRNLAFLIVVIDTAYSIPSGNITTAATTASSDWSQDENINSRIGGQEIFVFPDKNGNPLPVVANRAIFKIDVQKQATACADGTTYCEKVNGYPRNVLENILDNELDQFKVLQGTDELSTSPITQKIDASAVNDQPICPFSEEIVFPEAALNKENKWLFIINTRSFKQGVRVEKCLKPEQSCEFNATFPLGYKSVCVQKYIYRVMVAIDEGGKPFKETFPLPSCCLCSVRRLGEGMEFRQGGLRKAIGNEFSNSSSTKLSSRLRRDELSGSASAAGTLHGGANFMVFISSIVIVGFVKSIF